MSETDSSVTIVSGLPRSGTSMMMQLIDKGGIDALKDEIRTADDDNPKGYYEFEPVKKTKEDPSWLDRAGGKVVKMVHLLLLDLPLDRQYRVVMMRRNLREVIASQNVMLERSGKPAGDLGDDKIMKIFEAQLVKVIDYIESHDNFSVLTIHYNELMADPSAHVDKINEFLGGKLDKTAMNAVIDPKLYRQRK